MRRVDESNLTAEYVALHDGWPGQAHERPARFVLSCELLSSRRTQHSNARWSNQSHEPIVHLLPMIAPKMSHRGRKQTCNHRNETRERLVAAAALSKRRNADDKLAVTVSSPNDS